ncbi:hypothetical protein [Lacrimispora sp. 38-1]|uniref:hypothetical protein n=1 Tax=Lacrimispora sp. 38-1 TaxID=3125778 RepID=UPI003CF9F43F
MSSYTELIIEPKNFNDQNIAQAAITLESSFEVLLTGTVFNSRCETLEGAVVMITAAAPWGEKDLGYVITNQYGEFAIVAEKNSEIDYRFDIYEPVLTS